VLLVFELGAPVSSELGVPEVFVLGEPEVFVLGAPDTIAEFPSTPPVTRPILPRKLSAECECVALVLEVPVNEGTSKA
jgi:hypothetical protein